MQQMDLIFQDVQDVELQMAREGDRAAHLEARLRADLALMQIRSAEITSQPEPGDLALTAATIVLAIATIVLAIYTA